MSIIFNCSENDIEWISTIQLIVINALWIINQSEAIKVYAENMLCSKNHLKFLKKKPWRGYIGFALLI